MLIFVEGGKPENPEKNPAGSKVRSNSKLNPNIPAYCFSVKFTPDWTSWKSQWSKELVRWPVMKGTVLAVAASTCLSAHSVRGRRPKGRERGKTSAQSGRGRIAVGDSFWLLSTACDAGYSAVLHLLVSNVHSLLVWWRRETTLVSFLLISSNIMFIVIKTGLKSTWRKEKARSMTCNPSKFILVLEHKVIKVTPVTSYNWKKIPTNPFRLGEHFNNLFLMFGNFTADYISYHKTWSDYIH